MSDPRRPELTVIVPSVNGWGDLHGCLAALAAQDASRSLEVIVVDRVGPAVRGPLRRAFPAVRLIEAESHTTIPAMRAAGFAAASAPVVGVIEDHVLVPPDWAAQMLAEHLAGAQVVGGSVANAACDRLVDRAAFLCEYSHCLTPPAGQVEWLTGNNITYRRELLERFRDIIAAGRWEDHLHAGFRQAGVPLVSQPRIRVGHKKHYTVREYASQRYLYARAFAGMRVEREPAARRLAFGLGAFVLPVLLLYRILARALAARVSRLDIIRAIPLLTVFVTAWSAGELIGYWRGQGDTLARVC